MRSERPRVQVELLERALLDGVHEHEGELDRTRVDLGLVPIFQDERPLLGLAGLIDWRGSGRLSALLRSGFCTAEPGEQLLVPCDRRLPVERLVLVGLGPRERFDDARARAVATRLVKISVGLGARTVLIALPTHGLDRALAEATFEGLLAAIESLEQQLDEDPMSDEPSDEPPDEPPDEPERDERAAPEPAADAQPSPAPEAELEAEPKQAALASQGPALERVRWWVAADEAVVPRLRRVLSGPPRAARGGASLHT